MVCNSTPYKIFTVKQRKFNSLINHFLPSSVLGILTSGLQKVAQKSKMVLFLLPSLASST